MSAAKHTPGPWAYDGHSRIDALQFRKPTGMKLKNDDGTEHEYIDGLVALPYSCGEPETREANALLIAAAPDMFQALESIKEMARTGRHEEDFDAIYGRAEAAIAKATGATA